jgi:hypothetical protein
MNNSTNNPQIHETNMFLINNLEREKMNKLKRNMWIQDTRPKTVDPNRYLLHTYDTVPQVKIYRPYRREFGFRP